MSATVEKYTIDEDVARSGRRTLHARALAPRWSVFTIASAGGPLSGDDSDHWMVMLGYDAAKAIGEDFGNAGFDVRDEAEARHWLHLLARMYFADAGLQ